MSKKLHPIARVSTRTCPGPGSGSGTSWYSRSDGSLQRVATMAFMGPDDTKETAPRPARGRRRLGGGQDSGGRIGTGAFARVAFGDPEALPLERTVIVEPRRPPGGLPGRASTGG